MGSRIRSAHQESPTPGSPATAKTWSSAWRRGRGRPVAHEHSYVTKRAPARPQHAGKISYHRGNGVGEELFHRVCMLSSHGHGGLEFVVLLVDVLVNASVVEGSMRPIEHCGGCTQRAPHTHTHTQVTHATVLQRQRVRMHDNQRCAVQCCAALRHESNVQVLHNAMLASNCHATVLAEGRSLLAERPHRSASGKRKYRATGRRRTWLTSTVRSRQSRTVAQSGHRALCEHDMS